MKSFLFITIFSFCLFTATAQNVAINNDGSVADPKAMLDVKSSSKGVLLPRIADLSGITGNVPLGLLVFVTDGDRGFYYNASALPGAPNWKKITTGDASPWTYVSPNYLYWNGTANVGIGTAAPAYKFTVRQANIGITQENTDGSIQMGFYTGTAGAYVQTHTNTPLSFATNNGVAQMQLDVSGNVGIGTLTPMLAGLVVDKKIGAVNGIFGANTTGVAIESSFPGLGFNSYFNVNRKSIFAGYGSWFGLNPSNGDFYVQSSPAMGTAGATLAVNTRFLIDKDGDIGVEGNTAPHAPLSFANTAGSKISLYGSTETANYGMGIQGFLMQLYTDASNADIAFGYGGSAPANFVENMRIKGNGRVGIGTNAPSEIVDVDGNMRVRGGGVWFDGSTTPNRLFLGMADNNTFGIYSSALNYGFRYDASDGTLRLGTTQKATGYLLNIGGKAIAEEVRVQLRAAWPDYVFKKNYNLMPLSQLERFITQNNHLPNIPKADVLEKEGTDLGEMQRKMMEKIEELTLHIIDLNKKLDAQQRKLDQLAQKKH